MPEVKSGGRGAFSSVRRQTVTGVSHIQIRYGAARLGIKETDSVSDTVSEPCSSFSYPGKGPATSPSRMNPSGAG